VQIYTVQVWMQTERVSPEKVHKDGLLWAETGRESLTMSSHK